MAKKKPEPKPVVKKSEDPVFKLLDKSRLNIVGLSALKDPVRVSSGLTSLDRLLGGGLPNGKILEYFGDPSSCKSVFAALAVAEFQKIKRKAVYFDAEFSAETNWLTKLGVTEGPTFHCVRSNSAESVLNLCTDLLNAGNILAVIDSTAALLPDANRDGTTGGGIALLSRVLGDALKRLSGACDTSGGTLICLNQTRQRIAKDGVLMPPGMRASASGDVFKFTAAARVLFEQSPGKFLREDPDIADSPIVGRYIIVKMQKIKIAGGIDQGFAKVPFYFNRGPDWHADLFDCSRSLGLLTTAGAWFSYKETRLGQGALKATQALRDNPDLSAALRTDVLATKPTSQETHQ